MRRYHITLGSSTTAGGKVIAASSLGSINGARIALEGDAVACPSCKSIGKITCIGPRISETWSGKQVALENDLCICGCASPPKLKPSQSVRCQVVTGTSVGTEREVKQRMTSAEDLEIIEQYFSLLDENEKPVEGFRYDLYQDGLLLTKAKDYVNGHTARLSVNGNMKLVTWFNTDGASRHGEDE